MFTYIYIYIYIYYIYIYTHLIIYHRSIYISDVHICLHQCISILNLAIASIQAIAQFLQFLSIRSNISSIPQFLLTYRLPFKCHVGLHVSLPSPPTPHPPPPPPLAFITQHGKRTSLYHTCNTHTRARTPRPAIEACHTHHPRPHTSSYTAHHIICQYIYSYIHHGAQTDVGNREFLHEYNAVCGKTGVKHHCRTTLNLKSR